MESEVERDVRTPIFEATITADPAILAKLDRLDIDLLPNPRQLEGGRAAVRALVRLDQLEATVAAGATVELQRLVERRVPRERIMSSEDAAAPLRYFEEVRDRRAR